MDWFNAYETNVGQKVLERLRNLEIRMLAFVYFSEQTERFRRSRLTITIHISDESARGQALADLICTRCRIHLVRNNGRTTDSPMTVIDVTLYLELGKFQPYGDGREYFLSQWPVIDVTLYAEFGKFQPFGDGWEYFLNQWPVIDVTFYLEFGNFQPFGDGREYF
jgi:hypothetical protein